MTDRDSQTIAPEDRVPCPDDMCVGIIGANGKCGVCGKAGTPAEGQEKPDHPHDDLHERPSGSVEPVPEPVPGSGSSAAAADDAADTDDERVPCLDEMCVGILSKNGTCGTCGKSWRKPG